MDDRLSNLLKKVDRTLQKAHAETYIAEQDALQAKQGKEEADQRITELQRETEELRKALSAAVSTQPPPPVVPLPEETTPASASAVAAAAAAVPQPQKTLERPLLPPSTCAPDLIDVCEPVRSKSNSRTLDLETETTRDSPSPSFPSFSAAAAANAGEEAEEKEEETQSPDSAQRQRRIDSDDGGSNEGRNSRNGLPNSGFGDRNVMLVDIDDETALKSAPNPAIQDIPTMTVAAPAAPATPAALEMEEQQQARQQQKGIDSLKARLKETQAELKQALKELVSHEKAAKLREEAVQAAEARLSNERTRLIESQTSLQNNVDELRSDLEDAKATIVKQQDRLQVFQGAVDFEQQKHAELRSAAEADLKAAQDSVETLSSELEDARSTISELQRASSQYHDQLKVERAKPSQSQESAQQTISSLEDIVHHLQSDLNAARQAVSDKTRKCAASEEALSNERKAWSESQAITESALQNATEKYESLQIELDQERSNISELQASCSVHLAQLSEERKQWSESQQSAQQLIGSLEEHVQQLEFDLLTAREATTGQTRMREATEKTLDTERKAWSEAQATFRNSLKDANAESAALRVELDQVRSQVSQLQEACVSHLGQLREERKQRADSQSSDQQMIASLKDRVTQLESDLKTAQDATAEQTHFLEDAQDTLNTKRKAWLESQAALENALHDATRMAESLKTELEQTQRSLSDLKLEQAETQKALQESRTAHNISLGDVDGLVEQLRAAQASLEKANSQAKVAASQQRDQWKQAVLDAQQEAAELARELMRQTQELDSTQRASAAKMQDAEALVGRLEQRLASSKHEAQNALEEQENMRVQFQEDLQSAESRWAARGEAQLEQLREHLERQHQAGVQQKLNDARRQHSIDKQNALDALEKQYMEQRSRSLHSQQQELKAIHSSILEMELNKQKLELAEQHAQQISQMVLELEKAREHVASLEIREVDVLKRAIQMINTAESRASQVETEKEALERKLDEMAALTNALQASMQQKVERVRALALASERKQHQASDALRLHQQKSTSQLQSAHETHYALRLELAEKNALLIQRDAEIEMLRKQFPIRAAPAAAAIASRAEASAAAAVQGMFINDRRVQPVPASHADAEEDIKRASNDKFDGDDVSTDTGDGESSALNTPTRRSSSNHNLLTTPASNLSSRRTTGASPQAFASLEAILNALPSMTPDSSSSGSPARRLDDVNPHIIDFQALRQALSSSGMLISPERSTNASTRNNNDATSSPSSTSTSASAAVESPSGAEEPAVGPGSG